MRRLRYLIKCGYIKIIDHLENNENIFCITRKTCKLLNMEYAAINKTDKLSHYLACADFYYSIKNKSPTVKFENQYYFKYKEKKYSFRPDLIIFISRWCLVEIDLSNKRFEDKIVVWEAFLQSGEYKKYFEKYPPIIIVSTNVNKIKGIINRKRSLDLNYVYKDYNEVKEWGFRYESVYKQ